MIKRIVSSIPNAITCCNLLSGCIACIATFKADTADVACGLSGLQLAWIMIGIAAVLDFCDGLAARLLGAYSPLGKELDSLADLVSFGLAPGLMMFNLLSLMSVPAWLPWLSLCLPVFGALRLARFNVDDSQSTSFVGMPIPGNAIFWIGYSSWLAGTHSPVAADGTMASWLLWLTAVMLPAIALVMVCGLRMFSLKFRNMKPGVNAMRYIIIAAAIVFVSLVGLPGLALTIMLYVLLSVIDLIRA